MSASDSETAYTARAKAQRRPLLSKPWKAGILASGIMIGHQGHDSMAPPLPPAASYELPKTGSENYVHLVAQAEAKLKSAAVECAGDIHMLQKHFSIADVLKQRRLKVQATLKPASGAEKEKAHFISNFSRQPKELQGFARLVQACAAVEDIYAKHPQEGDSLNYYQIAGLVLDSYQSNFPDSAQPALRNYQADFGLTLKKASYIVHDYANNRRPLKNDVSLDYPFQGPFGMKLLDLSIEIGVQPPEHFRADNQFARAHFQR